MRTTAERRRRTAELEHGRREDRDGSFLKVWLEESTKGKAAFESFWPANANTKEQAEIAKLEGFRTWRGYVQCTTELHRAHENFVHSPTFQALWTALREADPDGRQYPWGLSQRPAGVPSKLLAIITAWHQAPKFTDGELTIHLRKIGETTRELIELLIRPNKI